MSEVENTENDDKVWVEFTQVKAYLEHLSATMAQVSRNIETTIEHMNNNIEQGETNES